MKDKQSKCCGINNCIHVKNRCKKCGIDYNQHRGQYNSHIFIQREEDIEESLQKK